jgi:hypothetical protein
LWETLAERAADEAERRRYLTLALGTAEGYADVRRVQALLNEGP